MEDAIAEQITFSLQMTKWITLTFTLSGKNKSRKKDSLELQATWKMQIIGNDGVERQNGFLLTVEEL